MLQSFCTWEWEEVEIFFYPSVMGGGRLPRGPLVYTIVANASGSRHGTPMVAVRCHLPFCPRACACGSCTNVNSLAWDLWQKLPVINDIGKLLQNKSIHIGIATKHVRGLLEFFKEFRVSGFENCCNVPKQISTGLEVKLNLKIDTMDRK